MKQDMTAEERSLLEALDAIVGSEEIRAQIYPIIERVRTELARNAEARPQEQNAIRIVING